MALGVNSLLVCLVVGFLSNSQGMHFTLDSTPDTFYCGHLNCSVDVSQNDPRILYVIGMSISAIAESNTLIRLASVGAVDLEPHVEPTKVNVINATGSVTRYHGTLILALRNETDCLLGSFLCEVDFVNVSGQSDMIREVVTPVNKGNCTEISSQLTNMADKLDKHSDDVDRQLTELKSQNTDMDTKLTDLKSDMDRKLADVDGKLADVDGKLAELKSQNTATQQELVRLETKLDTIIGYLSRPPGSLNTSQHTDQAVTCLRGEAHNETREKFLLWGRVPALCDTETDGGGWVIIQRRTKGDVDFNRGWDDYKKGFGTPDTDYWLGNDNIHNMTSQGYNNLRVDMEYQGVNYFAEYSNFSVADEISKYKLTVGGYHGNATDQFSYNSGMYFSTIDRDNDEYTNRTCARSDSIYAAWWHNHCTSINLNGMWGAQNYSGLFWTGVVVPGSVTWSEMKVRQVYNMETSSRHVVSLIIKLTRQ